MKQFNYLDLKKKKYFITSKAAFQMFTWLLLPMKQIATTACSSPRCSVQQICCARQMCFASSSTASTNTCSVCFKVFCNFVISLNFVNKIYNLKI
jgi:hypothetical protein